jgi:hypothetical protein
MASLLESDSEDEDPATATQLNKEKSYQSRLSLLSKLNLLGLIDLSLVACSLKLFKGLELAIKLCEQSIVLLKALNVDSGIEAGIASQNLIEELLDHLLTIKDRELEVIDEEEGPEVVGDTPPSKLSNNISSGH